MKNQKDPNVTNAGGMSRASLKRAKNKNKKRMLQEKQPSGEDNDNDDQNITIPIETNQMQSVKKVKKSHDDGNKHHQPTSVINDETNNDDKDSESLGNNSQDDEEKIKELLGHLNPSEILFPTEYAHNHDDDDNDDDDDSEDPLMAVKPSQLLQSITSEQRARLLFHSILSPSNISVQDFYKYYWEKQPLVISLNANQVNTSNTSDIEDESLGTLQIRTHHGKNNHGKDFNVAKKVAIRTPNEKKQYQTRFNSFLSKKDIQDLFSSYPMKYGKDLNVTKYVDTGDGSNLKRRITLDLLPEKYKNDQDSDAENDNAIEKDQLDMDDDDYIIAKSEDVWSNFENGCTIRLLCPHQHNDRLHALLGTLEDEFGCMVGANAYLTPGSDSYFNHSHSSTTDNNQGFAPHYDDIEAFILQMEGYKHWKVYEPLSKEETLPRVSSSDYTEKDLENIDPVIDVMLGPGDVLYMPRGWIHQACTSFSKKGHSLHLTISAMQSWSWIDLMEIIMPVALENVANSKTSTTLRSGLPRNFLKYMGMMYDVNNDESALPEGLRQLASKANSEGSTNDNIDSNEDMKSKKLIKLQNDFKEEAKKRIMRVCKEAISLITAGCDQIGKRFLSDRQPPAFTREEQLSTSENRDLNGGKIFPNSLVRLAKPGIARLVLEDDKAVIYHSADNSRVYHEHALSPLEYEVDDAPALEQLLTTVEPCWICVNDLIHGDIEDKMDIAQSLYDEGILSILKVDNI